MLSLFWNFLLEFVTVSGTVIRAVDREIKLDSIEQLLDFPLLRPVLLRLDRQTGNCPVVGCAAAPTSQGRPGS